MKRTASVLCVLVLIITCFAACGKKEDYAPVEGNTLRFTNLVEDMKSLDGQTVSITGYMCKELSSAEGIIYLMNAPCSELPFIGDNTVQLSDTLTVQLKDKTKAVFTEKLITVSGTLLFEEYTDIKGYTCSYRLVYADYNVSDESVLEGNAKKWQQFTSSGTAAEINRMFAYVEYLCGWNTTLRDVDGKGVYTDPYTALYNIETEGAAFYYGCSENYFSNLKEKVNALGEDYSALKGMIDKAHTLSQKALDALKNGEYTYSDDGSGMYLINGGDAMKSEYTALYSEYNDWLQGWSI